MTLEQPPALLQIVREPLKPGSEAPFDAVEREIARSAATLGCPHPYLGTESLSGPKEAWWFNAYESSSQQQQVYDAYAENEALMAALHKTSQVKSGMTLQPVDTLTRYNAGASTGTPWGPGRGRYLVVLITTRRDRTEGTVFESLDGTRYIITAADTREEADAVKASVGPDAVMLAVQPAWSFPAKTWVATDPVFWQSPRR